MQDSSPFVHRTDLGRFDASCVAAEDVLRAMFDASNDACWCMEFHPPVDLTVSDHNVVQQIFENGPVWRHCNAAMERLYRLPAGSSLNARPVHEIFPDNPSNRKFLLDLIAKGFEVDGAPALDRRYDGLEIYVENDVRAHIAQGKLYRMFGTVRDVAKHRRREMVLTSRLAGLEALVAAIPNPMIAVDAVGVIELLNPAAVAWLGQGSAALPGQPFQAAVAALLSAESLRALEKLSVKVRTLGSPMSLRVPALGYSALWQLAPRETTRGTGLVVLILPEGLGGL